MTSYFHFENFKGPLGRQQPVSKGTKASWVEIQHEAMNDGVLRTSHLQPQRGIPHPNRWMMSHVKGQKAVLSSCLGSEMFRISLESPVSMLGEDMKKIRG